MNREEFIAKLQMVYVGDRKAFNEIVGVYDNLKGENQRLNNVLNKYKNHLIKKMNEFVIYDGDLSKIYEEEYDYFYELNELKESDK